MMDIEEGEDEMIDDEDDGHESDGKDHGHYQWCKYFDMHVLWGGSIILFDGDFGVPREFSIFKNKSRMHSSIHPSIQ